MEQALRALSTCERRCTGRKHVGPKLVRVHVLVGAAALLVHDVTGLTKLPPCPAPNAADFSHGADAAPSRVVRASRFDARQVPSSPR